VGVPVRKRKGRGSTLSEQIHDLYVEALQTTNDKSSDKVLLTLNTVTNLLTKQYRSIHHIKITLYTVRVIQRFRSAVNLLSRVDKSLARPSLIVNLYEDEKGYSLVLCTKEGTSDYLKMVLAVTITP